MSRPLQITKRLDLNANLIVNMEETASGNSEEVFASGKALAPDREAEIKDLQAKIGEITIVSDFSSRALGR